MADKTLAELPTLAEVERAHAEKVLRLLDGNRTRSAKVLGISVRTLQLKLKAWKAGAAIS